MVETSNHQLHLLAARITKLESQNRFWKLAGLAATLLLALSFVAAVRAQQRAIPFPVPEFKAESFVLTDPNGATRGELRIKNGSPALELYGPEPVLDLYGSNGKLIWSTNLNAIAAREGH